MELERRCGLLYTRYKLHKLAEKFEALSARGDEAFPLERLTGFDKEAGTGRTGERIADAPGAYLSGCGPTGGAPQALNYLKAGLLLASVRKTVGFVHFAAVLGALAKEGRAG